MRALRVSLGQGLERRFLRSRPIRNRQRGDMRLNSRADFFNVRQHCPRTARAVEADNVGALVGQPLRRLALTDASAASSDSAIAPTVAVTHLVGASLVGSGSFTVAAITEPAITITGSIAITEPADTVGFVGHHGTSYIREPPWLAEILLRIFARTACAKDIEALMGDFEELFERDCASAMSQRRAVGRYWARVIRSIGPQMMQAVRRLGWLGLTMAAFRR
jgi:hypothetical protein